MVFALIRKFYFPYQDSGFDVLSLLARSFCAIQTMINSMICCGWQTGKNTLYWR
jgi:hypothetical protein